MAPRKTQSKQPKSRPSGNGSTMDQAEKKARHITSEKNRLTNIKTGLAAMLPMLPPEVQSIPGIAKNQTKILDAFGEEMARELQRERDLKAETDMLELHLKNATFPTVSDYLVKSRLPTPPDTQENPAYKPASKNTTDFSSQDVNRIPGNEPKYSTISGCGAHQTGNDLSFQQTIPAAFNFNSYQADSTPGGHPYFPNSPDANPPPRGQRSWFSDEQYEIRQPRPDWFGLLPIYLLKHEHRPQQWAK